MPRAPKKPCTYPGCRVLVQPKLGEPARCSRHPYEDTRDWRRISRERGSSSERGYDGKWQKLRAAYLAQHPLCEIAYKGICERVAREVDHIRPLRAGGQRLCEDNLQAVCVPCHRRKTRELDPGYV